MGFLGEVTGVCCLNELCICFSAVRVFENERKWLLKCVYRSVFRLKRMPIQCDNVSVNGQLLLISLPSGLSYLYPMRGFSFRSGFQSFSLTPPTSSSSHHAQREWAIERLSDWAIMSCVQASEYHYCLKRFALRWLQKEEYRYCLTILSIVMNDKLPCWRFAQLLGCPDHA